ncbi:hypothetical protein QP027_01830 [Corynebacterium breve]|uniref:Anti-sigma-D factor RsdA sigma factor binding region domain-containing protein n=1 Tax=Corynebacterium breve TaxID=3049799 RepID=A0ABY8VIU5_9CORY|nr:hypothetical protein [Corynebacterium breve]WIM68163.1 hypothetical protein QP027_01830 [Corynebacterium breve]
MMVRRNKGEDMDDVTSQLGPLVEDDAFLTALSQGEDPSDGGDQLAELLLELRTDVEKQMPPAPIIEGVDEAPQVISLAHARRRKTSPWLAGLVGAAAATTVVAGSGAVLYSAEPGTPLWEVSAAVFGDRTAAVELASTLDEMQVAADNGDIGETRELLDQARIIVSELKDPKGDNKKVANEQDEVKKPSKSSRTVTTVTTTVEKTAEPTARSEAPKSEENEPKEAAETITEKSPTSVTVTVTETVIESIVVTTTAPVRENPLPIQPSSSVVPAPEPTVVAEPEPDLAAPQEY